MEAPKVLINEICYPTQRVSAGTPERIAREWSHILLGMVCVATAPPEHTCPDPIADVADERRTVGSGLTPRQQKHCKMRFVEDRLQKVRHAVAPVSEGGKMFGFQKGRGE